MLYRMGILLIMNVYSAEIENIFDPIIEKISDLVEAQAKQVRSKGQRITVIYCVSSNLEFHF